ncbi:MAG TPA: hypothetical protein DDX89_09010 [Candidatus Omnitrophica bacterium]|nr:hypothetical protein [Candidatus Omnitrophota bacterium]
MNALITQALRPVRRAITRLVMSEMILKNLHPMYLAADFVCAESIPGDSLECGVFRGASFVLAHHAITAASIVMIDCDLYASAKAVLECCSDLVVEPPGQARGTLFPRPDGGDIPPCGSLEYIRWAHGQRPWPDGGVEGTVLIFDDWLNFKANPELGEQRACREWLQDHPELRLTPFARWGVTQQSFIVHRSEAR